MSEPKKTLDDGLMESRGLKAWWIDQDNEEEEDAMLMVHAIEVKNKFLYPVCLNVDFVKRRVMLLDLSILESC
jgi:hypothetical protein